MRTEKGFRNTLVNVGNHLAELRRKKGFDTIKEFAGKYDLPEVQYWRIEKGKANVTLRSLTKILAIHRVSLQDFFCLLSNEKLAA
jgi:transcriptional regulator with XRE-family HTH domain